MFFRFTYYKCFIVSLVPLQQLEHLQQLKLLGNYTKITYFCQKTLKNFTLNYTNI